MEELVRLLRDWQETLTGALWFICGMLVGHWLSIGRDDRKRRLDAFDDLRRHVTAATRPVRITDTQADAVLTVAVHCRQRQRLRKAIDRCNAAAHGYYDGQDSIGQPTVSAASAAEMKRAADALLKVLRERGLLSL